MAAPRWPARLALALLFVGACSDVARAQLFDGENTGFYNPCQAPTPVLRKDTFVMGISYWPGYTINNWGPAYQLYNYSSLPGLTPCIGNVEVNNATVNYNDYLNVRGAVLTSYAITVDELAVLRVTKAELDQLWDNIKPARPKAISFIAFRNTTRSEARYAASAETYLTTGTGIVTQTALIVNWDNGNLQGFEWYDFQSCGACGGITSDRCVRVPYDSTWQQYPQESCAADFENCKCRGLSCVSNCTTSIYVGHRGSDRKGATMQSAYQIEQLNSYSVTGWLSDLYKKVDNVYDNSGNLIGSTGETPIVTVPSTTEAQSNFQAQQTAQEAAAAATCLPTEPCDVSQ